ncbi:hypothetical protein Vretifemale_19992 [Volvox reticuliferus]|uniref:Uncharacterized protein n=1 Tax=Volvox reticuliferus TaxID=1737510 RepID=A0A8J4CYW1_9CHLO|nr:hypothetical protein Vretifemale_19992 [Volvox reticuliferus]
MPAACHTVQLRVVMTPTRAANDTAEPYSGFHAIDGGGGTAGDAATAADACSAAGYRAATKRQTTMKMTTTTMCGGRSGGVALRRHRTAAEAVSPALAPPRKTRSRASGI